LDEADWRNLARGMDRGGFLWTRYWNFGFNKILENFWAYEKVRFSRRTNLYGFSLPGCLL